MLKLTTTHERPWLTDFATIFAHKWYQDFPLHYPVKQKAKRADWTTHIGIAVRSTADLMGLFTGFEHGIRTDAVLWDGRHRVVAALEWEWRALHTGRVSEFQKLIDLCANPKFQGLRFAGLIVYGRTGGADYTGRTQAILDGYVEDWPKRSPPLMLAVIYFEGIGKEENRQTRQFTDMKIYELVGGSKKLLREQKAYPWHVDGSRWKIEPSES
jgi:hypothetical protein